MFPFVVGLNLGPLRSKLNSGFFNLYLDRFIILGDMVFFGTFCMDDKSFFDCSLDRSHFYIFYLFHYFYICCSVCYNLNNYILDIAWIPYSWCNICLHFFLIFAFLSICAMSSVVVDSSVKFLIFILSFFNSFCHWYSFAKLLQFWYYL